MIGAVLPAPLISNYMFVGWLAGGLVGLSDGDPTYLIAEGVDGLVVHA